jgi:hypothetical protein
MKTGLSRLNAILLLVMVLALLTSGTAFGAGKYQVFMQFYHLGELIAKPAIEVEEDKTTAGTVAQPGKSQYKIVVMVRPAAKDKVFVSLQFSSGKIDIQPNLLVDIGEQTPATVDKVRLNILIRRSEAIDPDTAIAYLGVN